MPSITKGRFIQMVGTAVEYHCDYSTLIAMAISWGHRTRLADKFVLWQMKYGRRLERDDLRAQPHIKLTPDEWERLEQFNDLRPKKPVGYQVLIEGLWDAFVWAFPSLVVVVDRGVSDDE